MNPLALCALLGLSCAAPAKPHARPHVLGMVAGQARALMKADWDSAAPYPAAPERLYEVMRDSLAVWRSGDPDSLIVLYVLEVRPVPAERANAVRFKPAYMPLNPTIHTHATWCQMTQWGPERSTCSQDRPESNQCMPSTADRNTQMNEGHTYDGVQCGRSSWAFYYPWEN